MTAACGYCGTAMDGGTEALEHMIITHGHSLPLTVYRSEDDRTDEHGRWIALARTPGFEDAS